MKMGEYKNFLNNCKIIEQYYEYLISLTNSHNFVGTTNEWIIDNYYLVAEIKSSIKKTFKEDKKIKDILKKSEKLYSIINDICNENNFNVNYNLLINKLSLYQSAGTIYLSYDLIGVIPLILSFIIIERLAIFCSDTSTSQSEKQKIRTLVNVLNRKINAGEEINLRNYIAIDKEIINCPGIIAQLNDSLRELGGVSNDIFVQLDDMLDENGLKLKELISMEHTDSINNNVLIANLFNSLRLIVKIEIIDLFDKLSKTEQILKQDKIYASMTEETKSLYRGAIIKKSKEKKEYDCARQILEKSFNSGKHIGFYLFKKPNYKLRSKLYVLGIIFFTGLISAVLSFMTLDYYWLSFILLLVPNSELVIQIINKVLLK